MKKYLLLGLLAASTVFKANAQNPRKYDTNHNGWYIYNGDHKFSSKWGMHLDVQFRRFNTLKDPQQFVMHTGALYDLSDKASVSVGYAFAKTYPYGDYPASDDFPEHRIYEQLQLRATYGVFAVVQRYRLEQRFTTRPGQKTRYTNRVRYQLKAVVPFKGNTADEKEPYFAISDEVMIGFGPNVQHNVFDQNRAYAGIGYKFNSKFSLEVGYMNQLLQHGDGIVFENNHTLQVTVGHNLDFRTRAATPNP